MTFEEYQKAAKTTIQRYNLDDKMQNIIPFLGIMGEVGSVITELKKKIRDGEAYTSFDERLEEELGDLLWYITTIATLRKLNLTKIAENNLQKTKDRFMPVKPADLKKYDHDFPEKEQFPEEFEIEFRTVQEKVGIFRTDVEPEMQLGDLLTDNVHEEDGYRFHDIFHFGYVAYFGWSPIVRKMLNCKRKSKEDIDQNEDGARAMITEEMISLFIYNHAKDHQLLKYSQSIDTNVLKIVQQMVRQIEVKDRPAKHWEIAILNSYRVFNELRQFNGGRVLVSLKNRKLIYIGKN